MKFVVPSQVWRLAKITISIWIMGGHVHFGTLTCTWSLSQDGDRNTDKSGPPPFSVCYDGTPYSIQEATDGLCLPSPCRTELR